MSDMQWAAVSTQSGMISDPPQNCFHSPELDWYASSACHGHELCGASVPPTIRVSGLMPHTGITETRIRAAVTNNNRTEIQVAAQL